MTYRKIDLVYLWVDGNDPDWQAQKAKWIEIESGVKSSNSPARWRDNNEFLYSVRSVAKFAPWINHIYIITGFGQVPKWLNINHPKITIVDHSEILPADALPTFNSMAIEAGIINIPGLSEYFLLANDDTFFGREIGPDFFVDDRGRIKVWFGITNCSMLRKDSYTQNIFYCTKLIKSLFGRNFSIMTPCHNIAMYNKIHMRAFLTNPIADLHYLKTLRTKFRGLYELQLWAFTLYDIGGLRVSLHRQRSPKPRNRFVYNFFFVFLGIFPRAPMN